MREPLPAGVQPTPGQPIEPERPVRIDGGHVHCGIKILRYCANNLGDQDFQDVIDGLKYATSEYLRSLRKHRAVRPGISSNEVNNEVYHHVSSHLR